jgi:hypothetical protein
MILGDLKISRLQHLEGVWKLDVDFSVKDHKTPYRASLEVRSDNNDYVLTGISFTEEGYHGDPVAKGQLNEVLDNPQLVLPKLMQDSRVQLETLYDYLSRTQEEVLKG